MVLVPSHRVCPCVNKLKEHVEHREGFHKFVQKVLNRIVFQQFILVLDLPLFCTMCGVSSHLFRLLVSVEKCASPEPLTLTDHEETTSDWSMRNH